jgi:hypothetical protein
MGFSISGLVGEGAQEGLEELLTRQLLEAREAEAQRAQQAEEDDRRKRFAFDERKFAADEVDRAHGRARVDQGAARERARDEQLAAEKSNADTVLDALESTITDPAQLAAFRAARVGTNVSADTFVSPADREKREMDASQRRIREAGATADARAAAEARHRPPPQPRTAPRPDMSPGQKFSAIQSLRRAFNQETQAAREVSMQLQQMQSGLDVARKGDMAAGSQAVLVTFQKILDPDSVVRETEYARSSEGQAMLSRIQGAYDKLKVGGAGVPVPELERFVSLAEAFARNQIAAANEAKGQIDAIATEFGIDPGLITRELGAGTQPGGGVQPVERPVVRGPDGKMRVK